MNHHLEKSTLPHSHLLTPGQWGREVVLVQDSEQGESYVSTRILRLAPPGGGHRRTIPLAETIGHELSGISALEDAANAVAMVHAKEMLDILEFASEVFGPAEVWRGSTLDFMVRVERCLRNVAHMMAAQAIIEARQAPTTQPIAFK